MADPTLAIEAKDAKPSASMAVRHPPVKHSALAVTGSSRTIRRFAEVASFQSKFVATLGRYIVVEAENEAQAGERGRVALEELHAELRQRGFGRIAEPSRWAGDCQSGRRSRPAHIPADRVFTSTPRQTPTLPKQSRRL
jgi:hypothetical protein